MMKQSTQTSQVSGHRSGRVRRALVRLTATALAVLPLTSAFAAGWPDKPIKLVTPSTPGGPPDVYARALADNLAVELGKPVIVENSPAVGGMVAANVLLRTPADGYTLMVSTSGALTIAPSVNNKAQYKADSFTPICQGVAAGLVLASNPSIGAHDFAGLVQWMKAQKVPPTYSSYAAGSPAHFLGYQLSEALKIDMVHVPYKSSPTQITDMLGGMAPLGFVQISTAAPQIRAGKLTAYATTGSKRSTQLPDVPTVAEVGYPQLETTVWFGLTAPKGLPQEIVQRLIQAHEKILESTKFKNQMEVAGLEVTPGVCGDKFQSVVNTDSQRWARVVKATGFSANE